MKYGGALIILLAAAWFAAQSFQMDAVSTDDKPVFYAFVDYGCYHCDRQKPIVAKIKSDGFVRVVEVNITDYPEAKKKAKLRGVPTYILVRDKKEVWRTHNAKNARSWILGDQ